MRGVVLSLLAIICVAQAQLIYVTFHGGDYGINNIYAYSLSGEFQYQLLPSDSNVDELRGMALASDGSLLACNAYKQDSFIFRVPSACQPSSFQNWTSSGLSHPYGIAVCGMHIPITFFEFL